ncbi:hypothetical protein N7478_004419 [Penicillium angulare]|uniref:uncharacterized protein n=1 Tax=Penicillium angulare TaxID=116970 RepID=UPI002540EF6F|nr:uncharacterized protein N7478_004419 [Penicillium angulare]KAJ5279047.1 hypothetical protein N7478_004419 [Penicillium angulare]
MGKPSKNLAHRRVVNACVRCRRHKIKCSGNAPCSNCENRQATCTFAGEETKVQITKRRLAELKRRANELERQNQALQQQILKKDLSLDTAGDITGQTPIPIEPNDDSHSRLSSPGLEEPQDDSNEAEIVNPLLTEKPQYVMDIAGNSHYLGHTSNWSLTMRLLQMAHKAVYNCPFPSNAHHIDSMTYDFGWNGLRNPIIPDVRGLPSADHAVYLIQATEFHTGQLFHLFDKASFMRQLHWFYENPEQNIQAAGLWFIHFLTIISLGKAFTGTRNKGNAPPGADTFAKAFMLLPDYCYIWKSPCEACELLCTMALYLQCIDWRTSAHNMISQAQRILTVHGFHVNINARSYDETELTRRRYLWWTVFILERQFSVLMGTPLGMSDQEITAPLPYFPDSQFKSATARIHVKLSQAIGRVVKALYRKSDSLKFDLLKTTQEVLQSAASVACDIRTYFPVPEQDAMSGISRVAGYMNLLYHQQSVCKILDKMIEEGNLIAVDQKTEFMHLQALFSELQSPELEFQPNESLQQPDTESHTRYFNEALQRATEQQLSDFRGPEFDKSPGSLETEPFTEGSTWADRISPSQLMDVVEMLDADDLLNWPLPLANEPYSLHV